MSVMTYLRYGFRSLPVSRETLKVNFVTYKDLVHQFAHEEMLACMYIDIRDTVFFSRSFNTALLLGNLVEFIWGMYNLNSISSTYFDYAIYGLLTLRVLIQILNVLMRIWRLYHISRVSNFIAIVQKAKYTYLSQNRYLDQEEQIDDIERLIYIMVSQLFLQRSAIVMVSKVFVYHSVTITCALYTTFILFSESPKWQILRICIAAYSASRIGVVLLIYTPYSIIKNAILLLRSIQKDVQDSALIESIPTKSWEPSIPGNTVCIFCLENYMVGDRIIILSCSPLHHMHIICSERWLKAQKSCPICRAVEYGRKF
jgi:hypothetical protein